MESVVHTLAAYRGRSPFNPVRGREKLASKREYAARGASPHPCSRRKEFSFLGKQVRYMTIIHTEISEPSKTARIKTGLGWHFGSLSHSS